MENLLQPTLENIEVKLLPLQESDFERLYEVASDPLVWAQHPNKNRRAQRAQLQPIRPTVATPVGRGHGQSEPLQPILRWNLSQTGTCRLNRLEPQNSSFWGFSL